MKDCAVIIAAAGSGQRFGSDKLMIQWQGKPIFMHVVEATLMFCKNVIMVVPSDKIDEYKKILPSEIQVVTGGDSRAKSVYNGLKQIPESIQWVGIVDAARPLLTKLILEKVFTCAKHNQCGCAYGTKVVNTTKFIENGIIKTTLDRTMLFSAETPQVFKREELIFGYETIFSKQIQITDDAMVYEFLNKKIIPFYHESMNPKITYPSDLQLLYEKKS